MKKLAFGTLLGIALSLPLPIVAYASDAPGTGLGCCSGANPSCYCGNADCCTTNCQKVKDSGSGCTLINCADQCAAKYPDGA